MGDRAGQLLGDPVSYSLADPRDGALYAALNLGHFGVKLHRRDHGAQAWTEVAVPVYPPQPQNTDKDVPWKLTLLWTLAASGADEPGTLWAGTLPGGMFRSRDRGDSWELIRPLWDAPQGKNWFGGGYDVPGIHSVCVEPRDSRHVLLGVSCGGVWLTQDGGASWQPSSKGLRATYVPPEQADDEGVQDPHLVAGCAGAPDVLWCQHHNGIWRSDNGGDEWQEISHGLPPVYAVKFA